MGTAALCRLREAVSEGADVGRALDLALAPIVLDCLEAVTPHAAPGDCYLVARTMRVVEAVEGGSWAPLTGLERDVALSVAALLRSPESFDDGDWDARVVGACEPYLEAMGLR